MHMVRTAARRRGVTDEVKINLGLILFDEKTFSFKFTFSAREFGNNSSEYSYEMHGDLIEILNLISNSLDHNKYNIEQRNISNSKLIDEKIEREVKRRIAEYNQSLSAMN